MDPKIENLAQDAYIKWLKANPKSSFCTFVTGRVESVTRVQDKDGKNAFDHELVCKAADEYDQPNRLVFQHSTRIASKGETLFLILRVVSWLDKPVRSKNPNEDGEFVFWKPQRSRFQLVEVLSTSTA